MRTLEAPRKGVARLREVILGGQDGLVNVLGLVLGVAGATNDRRIILIGGLAATFAESISMAAVAYTSSKAAWDYYRSELERERREIQDRPEEEETEVREIYVRKGLRGSLLDAVVSKITSSKKIWLDTMMAEELQLFPDEYKNPRMSALIVGVSAVLGSLIPLAPFAFLKVAEAILGSLLISLVSLFVWGAVKARVTIGDWKKSGLEMAAIGMAAAILGYGVGRLFGAASQA